MPQQSIPVGVLRSGSHPPRWVKLLQAHSITSKHYGHFNSTERGLGKASENSRCYLKRANKDHYSQRKQQSKGRTAPVALTILALIERRQALAGLQGQLLKLVCHCFAVRAGGETWQGSRVVLSIRCPHVIHCVKPLERGKASDLLITQKLIKLIKKEQTTIM